MPRRGLLPTQPRPARDLAWPASSLSLSSGNATRPSAPSLTVSLPSIYLHPTPAPATPQLSPNHPSIPSLPSPINHLRSFNLMPLYLYRIQFFRVPWTTSNNSWTYLAIVPTFPGYLSISLSLLSRLSPCLFYRDVCVFVISATVPRPGDWIKLVHPSIHPICTKIGHLQNQNLCYIGSEFWGAEPICSADLHPLYPLSPLSCPLGRPLFP